MRILQLSLLFLCSSSVLTGQLEKYLEKLWENWASERMAHDIAEKAKAHPPDRAPLNKEAIEKLTEDLKKDAGETEKERKLEQDIATCTTKTLLLDPYKSAVKAATKAAVNEFLNPLSTVATVSRAADQAFENQLILETNQFSKYPEKSVAADIKCIIGKRVKDPIARGMANCAVDKLVRNKSCFEAFLDN